MQHWHGRQALEPCAPHPLKQGRLDLVIKVMGQHQRGTLGPSEFHEQAPTDISSSRLHPQFPAGLF